MTEIIYIDRRTKKNQIEKVPCHTTLEFLYKKNVFSSISRAILCKSVLFSRFFGWLQKRSASRKKIVPFIEKYHIDTSEFKDPVESFSTFNNFFIRKLRYEVRPIHQDPSVAILPADGRYRVFPNIAQEDGFIVKGKKFSLEALLGDANLAEKYAQGSLVMIRLAPVDYHRFHFPCNCIPSAPRLINGPLYSVNPIALKYNIAILSQNKRVLTVLKSPEFGNVLSLDIGATNVGSIIQTFQPEKSYAKGDEKGYFEFGGSCILLLFEPNRIQLDKDLVDNTRQKLETLGRLGESLGKSIPS